jgi:hypothetical protein
MPLRRNRKHQRGGFGRFAPIPVTQVRHADAGKRTWPPGVATARLGGIQPVGFRAGKVKTGSSATLELAVSCRVGIR